METVNSTAARDDVVEKSSAQAEHATQADGLWLIAIFIALAAWTYLLPPIWNHGEAREGLVVQNIVHNHNWILPDANGRIPSKPPLYHWIASVLAIVFGLSDWTVRLPSALAAGAIATMTFVLGKAIGGRRTGWLAVGALLGMYEFWDAGTQARVDMVFAACVTASLTAFFFWQRDGKESSRAACYLAAALGVLAKGPAGAAFPALAILGFLGAEKSLARIRAFWSWRWIGAVLAIDIGWYAAAYHIGGSGFIVVQLLRENFDQVLGAHGFSSRHGRLAALAWLATRVFPWNLALVWCLVRRLRGERADATERLLHAWWMAIFFIVFLSTIKRAVYLLPAYPAIALLAGRALASVAAIGRQDVHSRLAAMKSYLTATPQRLALSIVIVDLALVLPNPSLWKRENSYRGMLNFVREVAAAVPQSSLLSATPELSNPTRAVVAYRLQRNILQLPLSCGTPGDYFLMRGEDVPETGVKVLATSADERTALVTGATPQAKMCAAEKGEAPEDPQDDSD
jgi:4-amino-4-deoxy-L-arabinose transferase-like glycosyltransferase